MNSSKFLRRAAAAAVFLATASAATLAAASPISGSSTGLSNATTSITFDEHVLDQNTQVTNQYADLGVTFSPYLYYSPDDPDGPYATRSGNYLGNFVDSEPDPIQFVIGFTDTQTRASFGLTSNASPWQFEALLDGVVVETFNADVLDAYYGFTGISFNAIRATSLQTGSDYQGDYAGLDNLQFGGRVIPNAVPEPESLALLALGLLVAFGVRRRRAA